MNNTDNTVIYYDESVTFDKLNLDKRYVIAIDSRLCSTHRINTPKINFSKAKKAAAFLLEDAVLDDIDTLDFFLQKTTDENHYNVIVIAKHIIHNLEKKIAAAGLKIERCVFDFMLLANEKDQVHYLEDEHGVLFRYGGFLGGKTDKNTFDKLFDNKQKIESALNISHSQGINFLNIDWLSNWKKTLYEWRLGVIAVLLLMLLTPVQLALDNYYLSQKVEAQLSANQTNFKKIFPQTKRIVDLYAQTQQKLDALNRHKTHLNYDFLAKLKAKIKPNINIKKIKFSHSKLEIVQ
ncbi:hypothetical protein SPBRAN_1657 [uncultured Candidatus Thioglobus sp.]|nr:hypothetical protein SPBRAN_1657 [uncultured Candidatus Thioglobus sp.]